MKLRKSLILNILIALIISSSVIVFAEKDLLQRLQFNSLDFLFRLRGPQPYNQNIVIIEIDDENILKIGRWPWQRTWHAAIIKALNEFGAKYIYFDIIFSEKSQEEHDAVLSLALNKAQNVFFPFVFQEGPYEPENALFPIEKFSPYLKGTGSINIYPDMDGVLRRIPLFFLGKKDIYYHVALQLTMQYAGLTLEAIEPDSLILSGENKKVRVPLISKNKLLINWQGKWDQTFKHYSFIDVLNAYQDVLSNKKPKIDVDALKDSICLVAVTAIGLYDIKPIPLEPEYPGVGVIANTISNILNADFLATPPMWVSWVLIYILALFVSLSISGEKPLKEIFLAIIFAAIFFTIDFVLFRNGIWVDLSLPLLSFFGSYLGVASYNFIRVSIEKKRFFELAVTDELTGLYNIRYFKVILKAECLMAKTETNKRFCIVMGDVDHFKHFNDTYGHQVGDLVLKEVAQVLRNSVRSSDVVARYGGEEMIILLRGASLENALAVAEKIRKNIETHKVEDENNTYKVTISIGVSVFKLGDNEDIIIKRADQGLYKAKEEGRNCVCTIDELST